MMASCQALGMVQQEAHLTVERSLDQTFGSSVNTNGRHWIAPRENQLTTEDGFTSPGRNWRKRDGSGKREFLATERLVS